MVTLELSLNLEHCRKLNFEKVSFYPDRALGLRFGSCFKVVDQHLKQIGESEEGCGLAPTDGETSMCVYTSIVCIGLMGSIRETGRVLTSL